MNKGNKEYLFCISSIVSLIFSLSHCGFISTADAFCDRSHTVNSCSPYVVTENVAEPSGLSEIVTDSGHCLSLTYGTSSGAIHTSASIFSVSMNGPKGSVSNILGLKSGKSAVLSFISSIVSILSIAYVLRLPSSISACRYIPPL